MELFALDEEVTRLETRLAMQDGGERLATLVELAWHLRQRHTGRAIALADEAGALLEQAALPRAGHDAIAARLQLLQAEVNWLHGKFDDATACTSSALAVFEQLDDLVGAADVHWIRAFIAGDRGDSALRALELEQAAACAARAGDGLRADLADAAQARFSVFGDWRGAQQRWAGRFSADIEKLHPALKAWVSDFFGVCAFQASDFARAIASVLHTYDNALASGQITRAIVAATNIGNSFNNLNDHQAALEWSERGLNLARPTGWPVNISGSTMQTAEILRQLGRLDAAEELLQESLRTIEFLSGSRDYAIATEYLGDVALDRGDYAAALEIFQRQAKHAHVLTHAEFRIASLRGQAHALSHLGRLDEALAAAKAAVELAQQEEDSFNHIAALRVLAKIYSDHALPAPDHVRGPSAALHYLQQALDVAAGIEGYTIPGELLDAIAQEHAKAGDFEQAFSVMTQANAAREKTHSNAVTSRAVALQVHYQTERERADAEHHRSLAAAEAQRAQVLQQTSATLERLGAIGQEITAQLDVAAVFQTLDRHVHGLLDAEHFSIYLFDADQSSLCLAFGAEAGKSVPATFVSLSDPSSSSARCVRERREVLIESFADVDFATLIPGTTPMQSQLFAPLIVGERVLGVMTTQSPRARVYGERERLIFRTLCAYGAIALDNAAAYRQLESTLRALDETKTQLEEVSITDPLTGLRNRRFLLQHIESDIERSLRQHRALGADAAADAQSGADLIFFMVDLDHFKSVNDVYGHAAGDVVLVQIRQRLQEVFRESDYIIRWGGEEFLVVARSTSRHQAVSLAERAHAAVAGRPFTLANGYLLSKTCSIGFACFPFLPQHPDALSWSQVVELADQCLYMAKRGGRNRWIGLHAVAGATPVDLFARVVRDVQRAVDAGDVQMVSGTTPSHGGQAMLPAAAAEAKAGGETATVGLANRAAAPTLGLAHFAPDGLLFRVNQAFCDIVGYEESALLTMRFHDLVCPEDLAVANALHGHIVRNEMSDFCQELRIQRQDGRIAWITVTVSSMRDAEGRYRPTFVVEDISRRRKTNDEAFDPGTHDALTGLPNRSLLQDRLRQALMLARQAQKQVAVIALDLDHFKNINDSLGREAGDLLLMEIGRRLTLNLRAVDTVARQGDDEFVVVLPNIDGQTTAAVVAQKLLEAIARGTIVQGQEFFITGSIGISLYPKDGDDARALLKNADAAMYSAKEAGRNNFRFYLQEMNARTLDRLKLEGNLRRALDRDEFVLHYQPQVDLASGAIVGAEALIRWQPAGQEMIYPNQFISIAEETNLISAIGEWVLHTACKQVCAWQADGYPAIRIGVNLSARQFNQQDIVATVKRVLDCTGCNARYLSLEITESMVMKDPAAAVDTLQQLSDMGVHLSIDDFGTGYSSLSYLRRFPIDALKIDRSFVSDIACESNSASIVQAIIALAHSMKLEVIAEGVETEAQLAFLREQKCHQMQGYYFSRPVPAERMQQLLAAVPN